VIENQAINSGSSRQAYLRAQDPHGRYGQPLLKLDSGTFPAGAVQVALTQGLATLYGVHAGGTWHQGGTTYQVTGITVTVTAGDRSVRVEVTDRCGAGVPVLPSGAPADTRPREAGAVAGGSDGGAVRLPAQRQPRDDLARAGSVRLTPDGPGVYLPWTCHVPRVYLAGLPGASQDWTVPRSRCRQGRVALPAASV
jgi:hypothetical protein